MNKIIHTVESIDHRVVGTTGQLREAVVEMIGDQDLDLIDTYVVTLYEEMMSDGSKARSVGIRKPKTPGGGELLR